jgi:transglutaminase-like putative cysteine protease
MEGRLHAQILVEMTLLMLLCGLAAPVAADVTYWNPRPYNVTYIFELEPDPNKIDRAKDLKLWMPLPRDWDSQKSVQILSIDPPPDGTYEDPEFGNRMAFWDFGKGPEKRVYTATIKYRLESYDIKVEVDPNRVGTYDKSSPEYKLYTRSEHTICLTPKIYELAKEAIGDEKNPYLQARRIAKYVYKKVHYNILLDYERGRGIQCLLDYPVKDPTTGEEYYEGCCTQISAMIVALCRAVGIPARCVSGYCGWPPQSELKPLYAFETKLAPGGLAAAQNFGQLGGHTWTEFSIPNYGWIPDDYESSPFNCRTVESKGRDIKIGPVGPETEGYGSHWVLLNEGRVDKLGLQPVWNIAKIHTARIKSLVEFDPFPADALIEYRTFFGHGTQDRKNSRNQGIGLDELDYLTRGSPDSSVGLTAAFNEFKWLRSYRGACICNVLKNIVGEDKFSQIVTAYEKARTGSGRAVPLAQFQELAETAYGQSLRWFFEPWMDETQLPQFKLDQVSVTKDGDAWRVSGHLLQTGRLFYRLPVELVLETEQGVERRTLWQEKGDTEFQLHASKRPVRLEVDPNHEILKIQRTPPHLYWCWLVDSKKVRVIYGTVGEAEANKAAAESFSQMVAMASQYIKTVAGALLEDVPDIASHLIKADTEATADDLDAECLIIIGRPAVNKVAERLQDRFPIKFGGTKFTWQGKVYDQAAQSVLEVVDEGRSSKRLTILCAGLSAEATRGFLGISNVGAFFTTSYLVFDGNRCVVSGEWEPADSDLVRRF